MKNKRFKKQNKRIWLKLLISFLLIFSTGLIFFTRIIPIYNTFGSNQIKNSNQIIASDKINHSKKNKATSSNKILQTPNYEENYNDQLNKDISKSKESLVDLGTYEYEKRIDKLFKDKKTSVDKDPKLVDLGQYNWTKKIIPKTQINTNEQKGSVFFNYPYQIKTETNETKHGTYKGWFEPNKTINNHRFHSINTGTKRYKQSLKLNYYKDNSFLRSDTSTMYNIDGDQHYQWRRGLMYFTPSTSFSYYDDLKLDISGDVTKQVTEWVTDGYGYYTTSRQVTKNVNSTNSFTFLNSSSIGSLFNLPSNAFEIKLKNVEIDFRFKLLWNYTVSKLNFDITGIESKINYSYKVDKTNYEDETKSIYYNPVFIEENHLNTNNWTDTKIKELISIGGQVDGNNVVFSENQEIKYSALEIDKANKKITGEYYLNDKVFGSNYAGRIAGKKWISFEIPISVVPFSTTNSAMSLDIKAYPIFIYDFHLQDRTFSQDDLKKLVQFKGINMKNVEFNTLNIDKTDQNNAKLKGKYKIKNLDTNQIDIKYQDFEIPIQKEFNFYYKKINALPIYIDQTQSKSVNREDLKEQVQFKNINMNDVTLTSLNFNNVTNQLSGYYSIKNLDTNQVNIKEQHFSLPVKILDLNYLFTLSPESASEWQHLPNGKIKYWQKAPETIVTYNNDWIYSFYTFNKKAEINQKFRKESGSWNFKDKNKDVVQEKINNYAINYWNYEEVKRTYQSNRDINYLNTIEKETFLDEYKHLENLSLNDYLLFFKQSRLQFHQKVDNKTLSYSGFNLSNFRPRSIKLHQDLIDENEDNTQWKVEFNSFKLTSINENVYFPDDLKFKDFKNKQFYHLHNTKIYADKNHPSSVFHEFFFQAKGLNLGQNISFTLEDGSVLDQSFKVKKAGENSNLQENDYGFVNTRYWTKLPSGAKQFVTLRRQNNTWFSDKFRKSIIDLDSSFKEEDLEYVFNQNINMVINPYKKGLNEANNPITDKDKPLYGIEKVVDEQNRQKITLETWDSGNFSHTARIDGTALFDGVFGADTRGNLDPVGLLTDGNHKISVDLKVQRSNLKTFFNITVDKNPVEFEIKSTGYLKQLLIKDKQGEFQELWYSNEPITLLVDEIDIDSISTWMLDSKGKWWDLPVAIKSVLKNKSWVQVIDSTLDYEGFVKTKITDQAGNERIIFFLTNKNEDELPVINFQEKAFKEDTYQLEEVNIFDKEVELFITNPLVNNIEISKISFNEQSNLVETDENDLIEDYEINIPPDYVFGTTLKAEGTRLPYVVDELDAFKNNLTEVTSHKWETHNKKIKLTEDGLYKVELFTDLEKNPRIIKYFHLNKNKLVELINPSIFEQEESYLGKLPDIPEATNLKQSIKALNLKELKISDQIQLSNNRDAKQAIVTEIKRTNNYWNLTRDKLITLNAFLKPELITFNDDFSKVTFTSRKKTKDDEEIKFVLQIKPTIASPFEEVLNKLNLKEIKVSDRVLLKDNVPTKNFIIKKIKENKKYRTLASYELVSLHPLLKSEFLTFDTNISKATFKDGNKELEIAIKQVPNWEIEYAEEESQKWILPSRDEVVNLLKELKFKLFNFEIQDLTVEHSLMFYSSFYKLDNWEDNLREGKYKISFEDIYGNKTNYKFLLLDKDKTSEERQEQNLSQIYSKEGNEDTAFWKGDFIWHHFRYQDKDHANWSWKKFLNDWIFHGLDPNLAGLGYEISLLDITQEADIKNIPFGVKTWGDVLKDPKILANLKFAKGELGEKFKARYGLDLDKEELFDYKINEPKFLNNKPLNINKEDEDASSRLFQIIGISISSALALILFAILFWRRFRSRKIK